VTAGPRGETAVVSRGHLRASHADREQVIDMLKAAFVHGRLTKDEFDARIGQAFASRTYVELAAITADIPAVLAAVQPLRTPVRALSRAEVAAAWAIYGIVLTVILTIAVVPGPTTIGVIAVTVAVIYSAFWLLGGVLMVAAVPVRRRSTSAHGRRRALSRPSRPACRRRSWAYDFSAPMCRGGCTAGLPRR
jgi:hypothetical protein